MDRKGSVCEKHGEYSPSGICRWCDPEKASSPPATGMRAASKEPLSAMGETGRWTVEYLFLNHLPAQSTPTCTRRESFVGPLCGAPATWRWNKEGDVDRVFFCEAHHEARRQWYPDWTQERIAPVASEGPKANGAFFIGTDSEPLP